MSTDLSFVADDSELRPLWTAVHQRLCSGQDPTAIAVVRVPGLSMAGVATLRSWLDTTTRRRRGRSAVAIDATGAAVPVRELLDVLGLNAHQLLPLVERATGQPVVDRAAVRRVATTARQELWAYAVCKLPSLPGLLARMRTAGVGEDEQPVRRLVDALAKVVARLPCDPPVSLAKLSHDCSGDPHYFDLDTLPGARLVTAIAELTGLAEPSRPDRVRALLARAGVLADRLWATVLLHQVRVIGNGPIDRRLRESTVPVALNLFDLTEHPPTFAPQVLTVVENPSVLEAAMTQKSPYALACTGGQLRAVDHALLQLAADQGIRLQYAGDLDAYGLQIADYVTRTYGARPIAMDAATVHEAGPRPSVIAFGRLAQQADNSELLKAFSDSGDCAIFQEHDAVLHRLLNQPHASPPHSCDQSTE